MAGNIIRPSALPPRPAPVATEIIPVDNGSTVGGATIASVVAAGRPLASQAEAEAGVEATKAMTSLTTKQANDTQVPPKITAAIDALNLGTAAQSDVADFATAAQGAKADTAVQSVVAGTNVSVDNTDPNNPIINASAGTGFPYGVAAGVGAGALTVSLKTPAGSDPTLGSPVLLDFRNATASSGLPSQVSVASALSLVVSSGSTLGTTSGVAFRLWLVAFNDAGTVRLGLVNCWDGASITRLRDYGLRSSAAEGGAGGADSAGIIYTGAAVSSKAMRVLGYLEWTAGLATAGAWSAGPDVIQLFGPGIALPGDTIQLRSVGTSTSTGTTSNTYVDTLLTGSIDLSSPANPVVVAWGGSVGVDASNVQGFFALHRAGSLLQVRRLYGQTAGVIMQALQAMIVDFPAVAGTQTYMVKIRNNNGITNVALPYTTTTDSAEMQMAEVMG